MHRGNTAARNHVAALLLAALVGAFAGAGAGACTRGAVDKKSAAYLCPKLAERCLGCRERFDDFDEFDCRGREGAILERCRGRAAARPAWLEQLAAALAQDSCRGFADAI